MVAIAHSAARMNDPGQNPINVIEMPSNFRTNVSSSEVLIKVAYAGVNHIDYVLQDHDFISLSYPAVPGLDVTGVVVSVGFDVTDTILKAGARVIATGIGIMTGEFSDAAFQT